MYVERLHITDRALQAIGKCSKMEALVVVRASHCTNQGMASLAAGCPGLRRLHVESWAPGHLGDAGLVSLAKHCKGLQVGCAVTLGGLVSG